MAKDWTPKKLEVLVDVPDKLDLERLRATGVQPGERLQPEDAPGDPPGHPMDTTGAESAGAVEPSPEIVAQLTAMGFSENGSKRAAVATQVSACMLWTELA